MPLSFVCSLRDRSSATRAQGNQCPSLVLLDVCSNAFTDPLVAVRQLAGLDDLRELSLRGPSGDDAPVGTGGGDGGEEGESGPASAATTPSGYREAARRTLPALQVQGLAGPVFLQTLL